MSAASLRIQHGLKRFAHVHFGGSARWRWIAYGAIATALGIWAAVTFARWPYTYEISPLSGGVGIAVIIFVGLAAFAEAMHYEAIRIGLMLWFFGWLYDVMYPRWWGLGVWAGAVGLSLTIAGVIHFFRPGSFREYRRLAFRIAIPLLLAPGLWFCANVDDCLDAGGAWDWAALNCRS